VLRRSRGERTRRKSWPERVLSSNTKLKLKLKLVQADQTRPRCEKTLYQDKVHRVITRSLRIWPGRRLGSSRVGSAGRTACRYHHHHRRRRRHRHHQPSSFPPRDLEVFRQSISRRQTDRYLQGCWHEFDIGEQGVADLRSFLYACLQ